MHVYKYNLVILKSYYYNLMVFLSYVRSYAKSYYYDFCQGKNLPIIRLERLQVTISFRIKKKNIETT